MSQSNTNGFLIAALGASAGGLEAFEKFFKHMPADAGIAFAVVQHLAPDHASALPELLARHTRMTVEQVRDHTKIAPNRVYIIPPNATLTIKDCKLRVAKPAEPRGHRTPIDSLFSSLAEDCGENAVCIILSGTGTDGTLGLRAIKEHGGMAMAQTTESAQYDAILRSAIATGLVDHVLPVEEMPTKLLEYAAFLHSLNGKPNGLREQTGKHLDKIHSLLRRTAGHDFSHYKESTISRRLERRMKALQIESVEKYVEVLERQPEEASQLFKDLLIGVTQFFRDPEAFEILGREVIPKLFEGKGSDDQVRVGVVGCASGEEAYSIAILLCEHAATLDNSPKIQIFATDIDERGLEAARKGRYPESVAEHINAERLERFFAQQDGAYQVNRELRELCIFSSHSFIKDPPFSRLDLISCRNVMIYLGLDLQQKVLPLFHYALRSNSFLFLGPSENVSAHKDLFRTIDKKHRIFQRKESVNRPAVRFPLTDIGRTSRPMHPGGKQPEADELNLPKKLERIILERYAPACIIVKDKGAAVYFSGQISRYLQHPAGSPETNVINMAREGLRLPLRTSLHRAATFHQRVVQKQVSVQVNDETRHVDLTVEPLPDFQDENLYMIVLEEVAPGPQQDDVPADAGSEETIRSLESELRLAHEHAEAAYEELETSNEELQSANEEYQSTNEELETSKEELQSSNEELETVNAELNRKVAELDHANSDLQNLLNGTQIATIFLDSELRIKNFTPAAGRVLRLIAGDAGRPITDLAAQFAERGLVEDAKEVLRTLSARERNLTGSQGGHYLMRILPYRTVHNVIDGVVITFTDVTQLKQAEQLIKEARIYAESIVDTVRESLVVLDAAFTIQSANESFYKLFQVTPEETNGLNLFKLGGGQWDIPELRRLLQELLPQHRTVEGFEVDFVFPKIGRKVIRLNASQLHHVPLILLAMEDITDRKRADQLLLQVNQDLKHFAYAASHDLQEPLRMVTSYTQLLAKQYKGKLDPLADQSIAYAVEGAHQMEMLLKGLRDYWAVNEGEFEENVVVDCNQVVEEAIAYLKIRIQESAAVITYDPLPTVTAEQIPLMLLFKNLISNGLKYTRPGEPPRIHISAKKSARVWNFSIRDQGIGIEAAHLEKIFGPFKRLHSAEEIPGSGLGLAICQRIVERYKGRMWAESTYGRESTFHFTIPVQGGER
jgi:two-component system, chemotaxis family, CheB/CheR fusion protein